ncbi:MAG: hypothetical protein AAFQ20_16465 [Bacteroidota bacterium]
MKDYELIYLIGGIFRWIFQLVVIVAVAILFYKQKTTGTILMLIGSVLTVVVYVFSTAGTFLVSQQGAQQLVKTSALLSLIQLVPVFLFSLGLLLFGLQYRKK